MKIWRLRYSKQSSKRRAIDKKRLQIHTKKEVVKKDRNIAGRIPEISRNRFIDRQSKKTVKKQTKKIRLFIED